MALSDRLIPIAVSGFLLFGAGLLVFRWLSPDAAQSEDITVPTLSTMATRGQVAFEANCATCHGQNGAGTDKGPALVHDIYNPGHHPDEAFVRASRQGVRQHHWRFGNMPPRPEVTDNQIAEIVRYIRELQEANGIIYRQHNM
jgi:mono/diheme cytochrome c family protein